MASQGAAVASQSGMRASAGPEPAMPQSFNTPPPQAADEIIERLEHLFLTSTAEPYREDWNALKSAVLGASQTAVDATHIQQLTKAVEKLIDKQQMQYAGAAQSAPRSYAAALQSGLPPWAGPPPVREVPARLPRELVVTSSNGTPQDRTRPIKQIVEEINKTRSKEIKGKVLAARRLPSGDIVITTDTATTKEQLEKDNSWLPAVSSTATVNRRRFPVMVHGMRTASVDCSKQNEAISQLMGQNRHMREALEILHVRWPRKAIKKGKAVTCLIVDVASPKQANLLIDEGLLFQSELKQCELYHGDCRLTQCFNCQKYGHTAKVCRVARKCGLCAAPGHGDHDCGFRQDPSKHRCVNCGLGHPAWFQACKKREAHVEKAKQAYLARSRRYADAHNSNADYSSFIFSPTPSPAGTQADSPMGTPVDRISCSQGSIGPQSSASSQSSPSFQFVSSSQSSVTQAPAGSDEGWTTALGKRRRLNKEDRASSPGLPQAKKGPGRPRILLTATSRNQSIADFLADTDQL
jgi:hypothetical protein